MNDTFIKKYIKSGLCIITGMCLTLSGCQTLTADGEVTSSTSIELPSSRETMAVRTRILNTATYTTNEELQSYYEYFKNLNQDVIGYIRCTNLGIDDPIVFNSTDNKYYLRKNVYGEDDVNGTIYLDYRCTPGVSTIYMIHGHNMKSGEQFAHLPDLFKLATLDGLPQIELLDTDGYRSYKIVSVLSINSKEETIDLDPFSSTREIQELKQYLVENSQVLVSEVPSGVDIILLNTCWYGVSGTEHNLHCIVTAVRNM